MVKGRLYPLLDDIGLTRAPVFPREAPVPIQPTCFAGAGNLPLSYKSQVRHGYDPRTSPSFSIVTETITESVELLYVTELNGSLPFHPAPQAQFEGTVAFRIERPKGQSHEGSLLRSRGARAVGLTGSLYDEDTRDLIGNRDDDGIQPYDDWRVFA